MSTIPLAEVLSRAETALEEGRLEDARRLVEVVRKVAPAAVSTQRLWGGLLLSQGELSAAEEVLGRVLEVNPEDARAWALLAEGRRRRGEHEEARALLQVAWECAPWQRDYARRLAEWFAEEGIEGQLFPSAACLASWYFSQGWWARASEECRTVLERLGERWDVRQRLCLALWWQGARREALAEAQRILSVRPETIGALVVAALSARERGDEGEARRYRDRLWELDPAGEMIERGVPAERWEERAWLALPEPVVVEEHWLLTLPGETELLWSLPSEEELEAARPSAAWPEEVPVVLEEVEVGLGAEARNEEGDGGEAGAEPREAAPDRAWAEELEIAGLRMELDAGWTGLMGEWEDRDREGVAEGLGEVPREEELVSVIPGWSEGEEEKWGGEDSAVRGEGGVSGAREDGAAVVGEAGEESDRDREGEGVGAEPISAVEVADVEGGGIGELVARGEIREAVRRAQVIVKQGGAVEELIPVLERIVAEGGVGAREAAMTLGAIYRRRGERGLATRYYELALRLRNE